MEESITYPWLQDFRGPVKTEVCEDVYFSAGQDQLESSSLQASAASHMEFTNSSSSTLSSETAEPYAYFHPYMQIVAFKGVQAQDSFRDRNEGSLSQVLQQLLPCRDAESQSQRPWGIQEEVDLATSGEPLHQLPGWTQDNCMTGNWQPSSSCTPELGSSSSKAGEIQLNYEPWMMEQLPSLYPTSSLEMSPVSDLFHPGNILANCEDHVEQSQQPKSSSVNSNELGSGNRKAAARRNRILQRQKSAPHQRGTSHAGQANGSGSPRAVKRTYSNKIPQELLMHANVQSRNMDPLRYILHKVLQPSDKEAEAHLPYLSMKEGIFITMEDFDTANLWTFRYRFWPNVKSRMYLLESTGEFVRAHQLKKGDIVILWRNNLRGTFVIQAMMALPNGCAREDDIKGKTKARG